VQIARRGEALNIMRAFRRLVQLYANYHLLQRSPVIVYSMERTGSVALYNSLVAHNVFALATHYLDPTKVAHLSGSARWASRHVIRKQRPAKIISLVRNPIENMASVFARSAYSDAQGHRQSLPEDAARNPALRFAEEFLETRQFKDQLNWFDREFYVTLNIDVYQHPFNKEMGYAQFCEGPFNVLILRTELNNEDKSKIVGNFLNLPTFEMKTADSVRNWFQKGEAPGVPGSKAAYSDVYRKLKQSLKIPAPYWSELVESRFVQHFFTPAELAPYQAESVE
jgi:hypothetical protein